MSSKTTVRVPEAELTGVRRWLTEMYGQRRRFATFAALVLALAVGYHVVFGQNGLTAYQKKKDDAKTLAQQLDALRQENEALKGHVDRLDHDPGAIEHQAREELHYTRPGEVIVTLPPEPAARK
jgi:cell division protein FtsB